MNALLLKIALLVLYTATPQASSNPVFTELTTKGVVMSDGSSVKLPSPFLPEGLDAAGQREAIARLSATRLRSDEPLYKSPAVVKVKTIKKSANEGPAIRAIDLWFVIRGNWKTLTSKEFLQSLAKGEEGKSSVVSKSGELTGNQIAKRRLSVRNKDEYEEHFVYSTFSLFDRAQLSTTRLSATTRSYNEILVGGTIDSRFDKDSDYPNQWRPLLRTTTADVVAGKPHIYDHAGGYAKITRLNGPADEAVIECHIVYEEPNAWFDGANLVGQKARVIVQEKVRTLRRKLATASEKSAAKNAQ